MLGLFFPDDLEKDFLADAGGAEAMANAILDDAIAFGGETREDDMTVVVAKVE